ncbi:MAG: DUF2029 domain-containing protein [Chloroflexi bacterium]|nr:DUF2029 domain-containing protein [Chloroflexota bacterium]MBI3338922.1 DUF2029 domain-containing protein [Chloroflexota bacterium]
MRKSASRIAFAAWAAISILVAASLPVIYLWRGADGFNILIQRGPISDLTVTLLSVTFAWLLAGLLLFLLSSNRIHSKNIFLWAGFFLTAFAALNLLRERADYGDVEYYARAALDLYAGKPLPPEYLYPPLWANILELFAPFGEKAIAYFAWTLNLFSLFVFYFLLTKTLERYNFSARLAALTTTLFLLVNATLLRTLFYVQVNLHVLNFILLGILLYRDRPFLSALAMALAVNFKASPAVLALAFLLELDWKWLAWFALSMILVAAPTLILHGASPFMDFVNNAFLLTQSHGLSFRDNSFDSFFTAIGEFFNLASIWTRILVYASKALLAAAAFFVMTRCVQNQTFYESKERGARLFNAIPPLFILMTLASPIVWEHHGIFVALAFLLMLKRLETPSEWMWFGFAYFLEFILPTFDFFPWSYGRLIAPLIVLGLMWRTSQRKETSKFFGVFNNWLMNLPELKA